MILDQTMGIMVCSLLWVSQDFVSSTVLNALAIFAQACALRSDANDTRGEGVK